MHCSIARNLCRTSACAVRYACADTSARTARSYASALRSGGEGAFLRPGLPGWRSWYTRRIQNPLPYGSRVRAPPPAHCKSSRFRAIVFMFEKEGAPCSEACTGPFIFSPLRRCEDSSANCGARIEVRVRTRDSKPPCTSSTSSPQGPRWVARLRQAKLPRGSRAWLRCGRDRPARRTRSGVVRRSDGSR